MTEHVDVLIVGAGLSGIGAAYHLQAAFPRRTYAILEARDALGGTWDLFRYPGVRSDSDMHTLGYRFRPWTQDEGDRRRAVDPPLRPRRPPPRPASTAHPLSATASSARPGRARTPAGPSTRARRTASRSGSRASFLFVCSGYYDYDGGHTPELPGHRALRRPRRPSAAVAGGPRLRGQARRRHRQRRDGGHAGPGAGRAGRARDDAAALADLHRLARPAQDQLGAKLRRRLGTRGRLRGHALEERRPRHWLYQLCRRRPERGEALLRQAATRSCRPATTSTPTSRPRYNPWDQRLCLVPDGDLFAAIRSGPGRRSSPTTSRRSPRPGSGSRPAPSSRPTSSSRRPGSSCCSLGGMQLAVDGERRRRWRRR